MKSKSKAAANRKNAAKSTGPRTAAGKQIVAMNSVVHGLRSPKPVVPGLESEAEWQTHRSRIARQMAPEGPVETALAERIATNLWRLVRCSDAEPKVLLALKEINRRDWLGSALADERAIEYGEIPECALARLKSEYGQQIAVAALWDRLAVDPGRGKPEASTADQLVESICSGETWKSLAESFNEAFVWPARSVKDLRAMVDWLLEQVYEEPGHAFAELREQAAAAAKSSQERIARVEAAAERGADLAFVETDALDKLLRYETTIHRAFQRDLHEFQRLQAMRAGQSVVAPLAIDVTSGP